MINEFTIGLLCGITATLLVAVVCGYVYQKRNGLRKFRGALCSSKDEFVKFLSANVNQNVHLDLVLTEKQNDEMKLFSNGLNDFFFSLPPNNNYTMPGGYSITIKSKGSDFYHNPNLSERRLKGYFYIENLSNLQHGWMSAVLVASLQYH